MSHSARPDAGRRAQPPSRLDATTACSPSCCRCSPSGALLLVAARRRRPTDAAARRRTALDQRLGRVPVRAAAARPRLRLDRAAGDVDGDASSVARGDATQPTATSRPAPVTAVRPGDGPVVVTGRGRRSRPAWSAPASAARPARGRRPARPRARLVVHRRRRRRRPRLGRSSWSTPTPARRSPTSPSRPHRAGRRRPSCAASRCPGSSSVRLDLGAGRPAPRRARAARGHLARPARRLGAGPPRRPRAPPAEPRTGCRPGRAGDRQPAAGPAPGAGRPHAALVATPATTRSAPTVRVVTEDVRASPPRASTRSGSAPGGVQRVSLTSALAGRDRRRRDRAVGRRPPARSPPTLRSFVDGDLVPRRARRRRSRRAATVARAAGGAKQAACSPAPTGRRRGHRRRPHGDGRGARPQPGRARPDAAPAVTVDLPTRHRVSVPCPERTAVTGVAWSSPATAPRCVPLTEPLVRSGLVPDVRPGLPWD